MVKLKTTYVDDIIAPQMLGSRRYTQVTNADGTVSFVDATTYSVVGSNFGATDINATNKWINNLMYDEYKATLTAGSTSLVITDSKITTNTLILSVFTSKYGVNPSNISIEAGKIVCEFNVQDANVDFIIRTQEVV